MKSLYKVYPLKQFIEQVRGISYKKNEISEEPKEGFIPLLKANNIQQGKLLYDDLIYVDKKLVKDKQFIRKGDIVIAASSGSKNIVGKSGQAVEDINFTFGAFCKLIRPRNKIDPEYLGYFLKTKYYSTTIANIVNGANINNLRNEHIDNLLIPVPSIETQQNISAILKESQLLIDKRKAQIEALDKLTQSVFVEMFGDPISNPKGWDKIACKDVTKKIGSGATPRGGQSSYKNEGISLIRSMNVYNNRFNYKDLAFIDEEQAEKLNNVEVYKNDILLNITGASVARSCIVPEDVLPARVNQHVSIIRANEDLVSFVFLSYLLTNGIYQKYLLQTANSGGATREAITKQQLENLSIILPPVDLQYEFARKIEQIKKQKSLMELSKLKFEKSYNALLQNAFKGELFTQEKVPNL